MLSLKVVLTWRNTTDVPSLSLVSPRVQMRRWLWFPSPLRLPVSPVTPVAMTHAVLPDTFLSLKIVNVTVIHDDPLTEALLLDNVHGFLSTS